MAWISHCIRCSKPSNLQCQHIDKYGKTFKVPYCSKECQVADWPDHKEACRQSKARLKVYNAGELLRDLCLGYCQGTAIQAYQKAEVDAGGKIHLYEGKKNAKLLRTYSSNDFPNVPSAQYNALVMFGRDRCISTGGAALSLVDFVLKGLGDIFYHEVRIKPENIQVLFHGAKKLDATGTPISHFVQDPAKDKLFLLSIRFPSGEKYAVDPFGRPPFPHATPHEPVRPWDDYKAEMIHQIDSTTLFDAQTMIPDTATSLMSRMARRPLLYAIRRRDIVPLIKGPRHLYNEIGVLIVADYISYMAFAFSAANDNLRESHDPHALQAIEYKAIIADGRRLCGQIPEITEDDIEQIKQEWHELDQVMIDLVKNAQQTQDEDDFAEVGYRKKSLLCSDYLPNLSRLPFLLERA